MTEKTVYACELCKGQCMACFYADECGDWLDDPTIPVPRIKVKDSDTIKKDLLQVFFYCNKINTHI